MAKLLRSGAALNGWELLLEVGDKHHLVFLKSPPTEQDIADIKWRLDFELIEKLEKENVI